MAATLTSMFNSKCASRTSGNAETCDGNSGTINNGTLCNRNADAELASQAPCGKVSKEARGWRRIIRNFTPSYVVFCS
ncbi:hypothetical protein EsDP_00000011 [Epichloe bromicola]|uniref:Uncharacterized protein n=1 Tax=Epichloe bromicola TaxID=79588 RepID=A0ABQ0CDM6_9HYPO